MGSIKRSMNSCVIDSKLSSKSLAPEAGNNIHRVWLTFKKNSSSFQVLAGGIWRRQAIEVLMPR